MVKVGNFFCLSHDIWYNEKKRILVFPMVVICMYIVLRKLKLDLYDKKQPTNKLKIRILSETSILYLIRHALFILIVGLHL